MTRKEKTIRRVLLQRVDCIDKLLKMADLPLIDRMYYQGKKEGLMQGVDIVAESLESIEIELNK